MTACGGGISTVPATNSNPLDTQFVVVGRSIYESEVGVGAAAARRTAAAAGAKLFLRGVTRPGCGGENGVAIDAWGINSYRGRTFTNLFSQLASATTKPVLITEYGATAAYHPSVDATYTYPLDGNKTQTGQCTPNVTQSASSPTDVAELPATGGRSMAGLVDYAVNTTTLLHDSYVTDGVVSGGFYFEWTDEWYKNGSDGTQHLASVPGYSGAFPGCAWDEAWFGLSRSDPGTPNVLTPRPTLAALSKVWLSER